MTHRRNSGRAHYHFRQRCSEISLVDPHLRPSLCLVGASFFQGGK